MKRSLLLTNDYPPVISGISTVYYHVWKHYDPERMLVLTPHVDGDKDFDSSAVFSPIRFRTPQTGLPGKLIRLILTVSWTKWLVFFKGVREIHAGQILSAGPIGLAFQKIFGIPCFLWVYGGETTDAYKGSKITEWFIDTLLNQARYLVTNSPVVTEEFLEYGIPRDRIIEIIPAVDASTFTPGPKPKNLVEKFGVDGKKILLTVSRLTKRKGHDLVLRAMKNLGKSNDLHYIIVGSGEDRERLEELIVEYGLSGMVSFAGRVPDEELPDYYRLSDIYVMPNREVLESTDSIEGFGISFIEANACKKPSIAGKSGGSGAAVIDGLNGYRVDPEDPAELTDRLTALLDNPELADKLGQQGYERVHAEFSWEDRAKTLSEYFTIGE